VLISPDSEKEDLS